LGVSDTFNLNIVPYALNSIIITDAPDGNEITTVTLNKGRQVKAYASGYDFTGRYVGLVRVDWSGPGGNWFPKAGTTSTFTAGNTTGKYVQTAQNTTLSVSDIFDVNIIDYVIDNIKITNAPNGVELSTVSLNMGGQVIAYASGYNSSFGVYVDLVEVNWSGLGGNWFPSTSPYSIFTAGTTPGIFTQTGKNISLGLSDTFDVEILMPMVDYITLTNAPNGSELFTVILGLGEQVTAYASGYNYSLDYIGLIEVNWSESASLGSFDNTTGSSSTFTAGASPGLTIITGENLSVIPIMSDTFEVEIVNATVDNIKIRNSSKGFGSVVSNLTLSVGQSYVLWAAAYNDSSGFIADFSTTTWNETSGGSVITVTSQGASTNVQAQMIGGSSTITATYNGVQNTTIVTVIPPTFDYIDITDSPGGASLTTVTLNVGESIAVYASIYNSTSSYISLIEVNWSESAGLGSLDNATGTSTTFIAGFVGGSTTITCINDTLFMSDSIDVIINPPSADYLKIRTQPGGGGIDLCDPANYKSYPVGALDIYYGAMYNHTTGYFADVPGNATWLSSEPSIVNVSSSGSSTNVKCDDHNWGGPVTITLSAEGRQNTTKVMVIEPTVDYIQIRDEPNGIGDIVTARIYVVWQVEEFYAAAYNNTADYLKEVESTWWSNDTLVGKVTSPGLWTNFTAQKIDYDGICHVKADHNGIQNSTGILRVLAPRIDFIVIRDSPNGGGNWVVDKIYNEGYKDVFWAAGYNVTADYIKDVEAIWESNNTIVGKVIYGPNEYTDFTAGWRGGYCRITATFGTLTNETGPIFVINFNQLPTAKAKYHNSTGFAGGNFSFQTDITLRVTGRKKNFIKMDLEEDGIVVEHVTVTRHSNQPDIGTISYEMDVHRIYQIVLNYYGVNGGSNPVIVTFEFLGNIYSIHLLFNSQHGVQQKAIIEFNDVLPLVGVGFFDGFSSTDFEGYLIDYGWDFGDGTTGKGETLAHTYDENGDYTVTLEVTDDEGGTDKTTITVNIDGIDDNNQANAILGQKASKSFLNGSGQYVVILECPADLIITNLESEQIGLFNRAQINEIDGAFIAMLFSDVEVYYIPYDKIYTFEVKGLGSGLYNLSVIGVSNDIAKKYGVYDVTCSEITLDIYIINFEDNKVSLSTKEDDKLYSLEFLTIIQDHLDRFYLTNMKLNINAVHIYKINNWERLSSNEPVTLSVDENNDGITDKHANLESGLNGDEINALLLKRPVGEPAFPILLFVIVGCFCAIGAVGILTEVGKWGLLILFLPLYTRIKKEELLDQPTRYKIYGYIIGNPGAHFGLIKVELELGSGQLVYHLRQLQKANLIYSREDGVKKRFYPAHVPKPRKGLPHISDIQEKILGIIKNNSGISQKKVASSVGISRQVAGYHLTIMEGKGVIKKEVVGRNARYYPS
jgi:DNA-binding transcriptional ArsR family regulator